MNRLYKLKSWFSVSEAAKRLSSTISGQVESGDLLQLALEGHLRLSWFTRHVPAQQVARSCLLFGRNFSPLPPIKQFMSLDDAQRKDTLLCVEGWHSTEELVGDEMEIPRLYGPYYLELELCGALKDWVHSLITHTGGELITLDGFFVSDSDDTIWQIMEHNRGHTYKNADGEMVKTRSFYHPGGIFPPESELIFLRKDIEAFEQSLAENDQVTPIDIKVKRVRRDAVATIIHEYLDRCSEAGIPANVDDCWQILVHRLDLHADGYIIWYTQSGDPKHLTKNQVSGRFNTALSDYKTK